MTPAERRQLLRRQSAIKGSLATVTDPTRRAALLAIQARVRLALAEHEKAAPADVPQPVRLPSPSCDGRRARLLIRQGYVARTGLTRRGDQVLVVVRADRGRDRHCTAPAASPAGPGSPAVGDCHADHPQSEGRSCTPAAPRAGQQQGDDRPGVAGPPGATPPVAVAYAGHVGFFQVVLTESQEVS